MKINQILGFIALNPKSLAIPFPYSESALKKFLTALSWISLGTPDMCLAMLETVCSLSLSVMTFLKRFPG